MTIMESRRLDASHLSTIQANSHRVSSDFAPLGVRLAVEANSPDWLDILASACRGWEGAPDPGASPLRLRLAVEEGLAGAGTTRLVVEGSRLRISGPGVEAEADAAAGGARCAVSADWLEAGGLLVGEVLDPLLLFLLTRSGRAPVHASAFLAGDVAVLLAGPSGAGKSCLALAAHRAGLPLLSEDIVYVQRAPVLRVWGMPRPIHIFPADGEEEPEGAIRLRNGKLKRAIPLPAGSHAATASRAVLCLLERGRGAALEPAGPGEALRRQRFEPGFDLLRGDIEAALSALTPHGAWRLTLSDDPAEAIDLLVRNLGRLESTAAP